MTSPKCTYLHIRCWGFSHMKLPLKFVCSATNYYKISLSQSLLVPYLASLKKIEENLCFLAFQTTKQTEFCMKNKIFSKECVFWNVILFVKQISWKPKISRYCYTTSKFVCGQEQNNDKTWAFD